MDATSDPWESRVRIVRNHFEAKGYRVHSGLQFGCELVLYADDPSKVHSDFCVHVVREGMYFVLFCFFYWIDIDVQMDSRRTRSLLVFRLSQQLIIAYY